MDREDFMSRFGFPTYLWWGMPDVLEPRVSFDEALKKIERLGFHYTDIYLVRKDLYDPDVREMLDRSFRNSSVKLATVAGEGKPFGTFDREVEERITNDLLEEVKFASDLGAKNVGIRTAKRIPERHDEQIEILVDTLLKAIPLCDEFDMNITLEGHSDQVATYTEDQIRVREMVGSSRIGVNLDVAWAYASGLDPVGAIKELSDLVFHVHLRDARRGEPLVLPGEGEVDFIGVFKALREIGYDAPMIMELETHCFMGYTGSVEEGVEKYRDFIIEMWEKSD